MDMEDEEIPEGDWFCSDNCKKQKRLKKEASCRIYIYRSHLRVIWRGLNQRVRKDAIRENDGNRIIMHWKFDMLHFYDKHHPKYFLI
jgi:predicted nucleic acid-binding Zn ribbon protein